MCCMDWLYSEFSIFGYVKSQDLYIWYSNRFDWFINVRNFVEFALIGRRCCTYIEINFLIDFMFGNFP